ncbi:MAG: ClC family H(+)/Cl(-) exchange transporter [Treponema sp.]|jgi:H+/Cl- antiporter ClcA|nr:ClC family H(+)/Cl(-) exchange transporter [Treponema sp.]
MFTPQKQVKTALRHFYHSRLAVIFESIIIGFFAGCAVVLFRYLITKADIFRPRVYRFLFVSPFYWKLIWGAVLVLLGLFLGFASKVKPLIKGSGIPQVKGVLLGCLPDAWMPELPLKMITGFIALAAGLSLGREGPSIQIAAFTGMALASAFKQSQPQKNTLICAASAAGLSAAFNAPLAGVLFVLEELQPGFSPLLIACAMGASMTAEVVANFFLGTNTAFNFYHITPLPLIQIPWIILLGIICALAGGLFKHSLYTSQDIYNNSRIPQVFRPIIPLLVSIPLTFYFADITAGGHGLIESLAETSRDTLTLCMLLAGKILFTALCYGSGTAGGIFLPLLACGALTGYTMGHLLVQFNIIGNEWILNYIILGMTAFFTTVVKAPVTGIVLILEMSGNFNHLNSLVMVSLSGLIMSDIIASPPVYAVLLNRLLGKHAGGKTDDGPSASSAKDKQDKPDAQDGPK